MSFTFRLFGGVTLAGEQGPLSGPAVQRHRLALLALLAGAWPRAVSREKLMGWLWPERDTEPARRLLNQAVHALRQALGADAIVSAGEELRLNAALVRCDLVAFEEALAGGAPERAVALYGGPFLDGFFLDDAPEFERWVDGERDRLSTACARAVEELAEAAERAGNLADAVERWKARATLDPLDSRVALRLMHALERAGNRAGALQYGMQHQQLLRDELEIEPDREVLALMEELRRSPMPAAAALESAPPNTQSPSALEPSAPVAPVSVAARRPGGSFLYAALAVLAVVAIGGAIRLASGSGGRDRAGGAAASAPAADEIARAVARELRARDVGLVCLAGYMRLVGTPILDEFPNAILNVHPSLLPAFPGLHPQRQALEHGARVSGATVHFVDDGVDTGPIVLQAAVPVMTDDTEATLADRILVEEHRLYVEAVRLFAQGRLEIRGRRVRIRETP